MLSTMLYVFAMAGGTAPQSGEAANPIGMFLPIILIFAIMYLLIFRPQAKKQKEHQKMLNTLEKGVEVVTAGGIYGTVMGLKKNDTVVILKIADNVKIDITKSSISQIVMPEDTQKK